MSFSLEEITRLAPDEASIRAAKSLTSPGKWPTLGASEVALWGECQGSGSKPYQVQMDFAGPAFRCSCPSRKFPCKHGLALLLLQAEKPQTFAADPPPAWVEEWLASRRNKAEKQEQKKTQEAAAPADPQAVAKREAKRLERMSAGAEELQRWLHDQMRQGLANLRSAHVDWRGLAARMVDAQAPGLSRRVKDMESIAAAGGDWSARLLGEMGQAQLLLDGWRRRAELGLPQQADLRTALGWPLEKDEVLQAGERVADHWELLGQVVDENDKLWERRVWLRGRESGRRALLLDFAHGNKVFEQLFSTGAVYRMELAFYPSAQPRRALALDAPALVPGESPAPPASLEDELGRIADAIAANPWIPLWPMQVAQARLGLDNGAWSVLGDADSRIPLILPDDEAWQLMALGGGRPLAVFGEWDGQRLRLLSAWADKLLWTSGGQG